MTRRFYPAWYRIDAIDGFLIWFSDDQDGLVTQQDGSVPSFRGIIILEAYAALQHITLEAEEPALHDLDVVAHWLSEVPCATTVDCEAMLAAWNLFSDLAASTNRVFERERAHTQRVYEKLFWGNNLPAMTPAGQRYIPQWNPAEVRVLRDVLQDGLRLFREMVDRQ